MDEKEERTHYYIHLYFACECGGVQTQRQPPLLTHRADEGYAKEARLTRRRPSAPHDHRRQEATALKTLLLAHEATLTACDRIFKGLFPTLSLSFPPTNQHGDTSDAPIQSPTAGCTANGGTLIGLVSTGVSLKLKQSQSIHDEKYLWLWLRVMHRCQSLATGPHLTCSLIGFGQ